MGMRLGKKPRQIVTTTPRPTPVVKELVRRPDVYITKGSTYDNRANLSENFFSHVIRQYEGTRLGRQELNAELLTDNPFALWNLENIDAKRVAKVPEDLELVVVAVDPPVTASEDSDECGIIVAGRGVSGQLYVIADCSIQGATPAMWASKAALAHQTYLADRIVAEANQGGLMVQETLKSACNFPVQIKLVHASRGKVTRAEPVSALYEQGRVSHVGELSTLEDQMCEFTSAFDRKAAGYSPDRVDALVWAMMELAIPEDAAEPRIRNLR
jgi:phage terminase large subunit-like protein